MSEFDPMTDDELKAEYELCAERAIKWCKTPWHDPEEAQASARYWSRRARAVNAVRFARLDARMNCFAASPQYADTEGVNSDSPGGEA